VHGPLGGEKGCGEKKTGDDDTRCFMKHCGGMEQRGGSSTGGAGARWRSKVRGPSGRQRLGAAEAGAGRWHTSRGGGG
jgi:hypothetical protein